MLEKSLKIQNKFVMVGRIVNLEKDVTVYMSQVTVFQILARKMVTAQMLDMSQMD